MKPTTKRLCALLCVLVLLITPLFSVPVGADEVDDKRAELEELKKEQEELQKEIDKLDESVESQQKKVNSLWAQVSNLGKQIDGYRAQISGLDKQIAEQEARIVELNEQIAAKEVELEGIMAKLKKRLRAIGKTGNQSLFQLFFNAESYEEYLIKSKIMETIADYDQGLIDKANAEKKAIEDNRAEVEAKKAETEEEKAELQTAKTTLDAQYQKYDDTYTAARNTQIALEKQLGTYEKKMQQVKKAEDDLDREIAALLNGTPTTSTYGGKMYWPAPALTTISSPFGKRSMGWHGGVDLWCYGCLGKPIYAAASGTVIKAQSNHYSYGNFVMIDHGLDSKGRRIVTLYAHMRYTPMVTNGQAVTGGVTQLGVVGNTGNSFGAHLHFEVRVDNVRVDPIGNGYIVKPS